MTSSLKILITGSTGLIGSSLVPFLREKGFQVFRLTRKEKHEEDTIVWDPSTGYVPLEKLEGFDVIIHLAGENIAGFWTKKKKNKLFISRCRDTWLLSEALTRLQSDR